MVGCGIKKPSGLLGSTPGNKLATETFLASRGNYSTRFAHASFHLQVLEHKRTFTGEYFDLSSFIFSLNVSRLSLINLATCKSISENMREGWRSLHSRQE